MKNTASFDWDVDVEGHVWLRVLNPKKKSVERTFGTQRRWTFTRIQINHLNLFHLRRKEAEKAKLLSGVTGILFIALVRIWFCKIIS